MALLGFDVAHQEVTLHLNAMSGHCHVYVLANRRNGTLYIGVTSDLKTRIWQHKNKALPGFSCQYGVSRLVYFESFSEIEAAIVREKQLKAGSRAKKISLIERENNRWEDLSATWF